jgi:hypothetical protein
LGCDMEIARGRITARSVEPIPCTEYTVAAAGKVESDHGANMGPASAGATGPMQFLPSRWENARVDGKGDAVVNRMDPEDAIPAATRYLQGGDAPLDRYKGPLQLQPRLLIPEEGSRRSRSSPADSESWQDRSLRLKIRG